MVVTTHLKFLANKQARWHSL